MGNVSVQSSTIRNFAVCGHSSSGKTTLIDRLLYLSGEIPNPVGPDDRNSVCDYDELEKLHHHTIESTCVHFQHGGRYYQAIDTPGYPDFIGQTIGALSAVEMAVIVVNAHSGIEVGTRRAFQEAGKLGLGRMIVINKLDDEQANFDQVLAKIRDTFGSMCSPMNIPNGQGAKFTGVISVLHPTENAPEEVARYRTELIEEAVEVDDEFTEKYFAGHIPTDDELMDLVPKSVVQGHFIPVLCVCEKSGVGLPELLDALDMCCLNEGAVQRMAYSHGEQAMLSGDPAGPTVAQVFKTRVDPFVHKISYLRVFSGTLHKEESLHLSQAKRPIKLGQLYQVQGSELRPIDEAPAGMIVAVTKIDDLHMGMCLGDYEVPAPQYPQPMMGPSIYPKNRGDEGKLSAALHKLVEEDPTLRIDRDPQTHELVMKGLSDLHIQVALERLKLRDKMEVETREPRIAYRETILEPAEGSYRHKKQSGGRGQFGEVHIRMYPFPLGMSVEDFLTKDRFPSMREHHYDADHRFIWVDSVVGGSIPNNFLPAVEKGFKERMAKGVVSGHQVENVAVEVHFGKYHAVDSSEAAFKTAGAMCFRNVFLEAKPALLEPIVHMQITAPTRCVGDVTSDLSGRRGRVLGMENNGSDMQLIEAEAPLAELRTYSRTLSSITGGQGSFSMELSRYDVAPANVMKELVEHAHVAADEEE